VSAIPGLGPANIRLSQPDPDPSDPAKIIVEMAPDGDDIPDVDEKGNVLRINHGDGSVSVSLDGKPLNSAAANDSPTEWFGNLIDQIDESELNSITEDLLLGIADDLESRKEWIESRAMGIKLLGLTIEIPNTQGASDGAPVEGMSKVRHPLLLEAVLRFQANARSELLPTDGPVKIRNDSIGGMDEGAQTDPAQPPMLTLDQLANLLEHEMNHYLTAVASEYYPDTDRMLFMAGFGGDGFKKVYQCPLRNRPVSESVDADDLIVNQSATDLANAQRVTHRVMMKPSTVKRMQILGVYRDIDLGDPVTPEADALQQEEKSQQGLTPESMLRPENREREIYETCCELNIQGFEHKHKGKESGLQIPYVVTIDKSSRRALSVVRNYAENDQKLPIAKKRFVKYPFVSGIGFYGIGLLHILGNTTNAVTAAWRLMIDNGMFANFPGFLISKGGSRQNTNIMRVPPGGATQIDTGGNPIGASVMPLPYNTAQMPPLMSLVQDMAETGRRIGGTAEIQVGEGRADVPVGTTMALIEQAIKVMNAVHKRMHAAQAEEFQMLKELIKEDPDAFLAACHRGCRVKATQLDRANLIRALENCDLVPQADPNTSSSGQRIMKVLALKQLQAASPNLYDPIACDTAALAAIGWPDPEQFFVPPSARGQPPPQLMQMQAQMANEKAAAQAKITEAQARTTEAQAKAADTKAKVDSGYYAPKPEAGGVAPPEQIDTPVDQLTAQAKMMDAKTRQAEIGLKAHELMAENKSRERDAADRDRQAAIDLAGDLIRAPTTEGGGQVNTSGVGKKATAIIKDVDKGVT
jgi:hypothetical protein